MEEQSHLLGLAHDAADTVRNCLNALNFQCEYIDLLIQEIAQLRDNPDKVPDVPPYERPTGKGLIYSPDTRDAIGYIEIKNNNAPRYMDGGIEGEFWNTISPITRQTLHLKLGLPFLVAVKLENKWDFSLAHNMPEAISTLSNHHGKIRVLIQYTK